MLDAQFRPRAVSRFWYGGRNRGSYIRCKRLTVTVAILAQGTSRAVAVTQAFLSCRQRLQSLCAAMCGRSIPQLSTICRASHTGWVLGFPSAFNCLTHCKRMKLEKWSVRLKPVR